MKNFSYVSYSGPEKYIFIRAYKSEYREASAFAETLIEKEKIRVFFDASKAKDEHYPDEIASGILNSELCIFALSEKAQEDLEFRNSINYALSIKKKVICLKLGNFEFGHGLKMQLANIETVHSFTELKDLLDKTYINEELIGKGQQKIVNDNHKKKIVLGLVAIILVILAIGGVYAAKRINYYNSSEYVLSSLDDHLDYFDFTGSGFAYEDLVYLKDKTITKLNLADMDLMQVDLLTDLNVKEIDLSGNPNVETLGPLLKCGNLEKITVSQDMYIYLQELEDSGIRIVISRQS